MGYLPDHNDLTPDEIRRRLQKFKQDLEKEIMHVKDYVACHVADNQPIDDALDLVVKIAFSTYKFELLRDPW
jgi:hypothetical protein